MSDSIERLSFEMSTRALAEQERMLAGLRTTAGTLVAAASVAASLRTPARPVTSFGVSIALAACALSVACAVWVLLPHGLAFAVRGVDLRLIDRRGRLPSADAAHLLASRWTERQVRANQQAIARMALSLSLGCVLLLIEIVSLALVPAW